ncbi:hypothetical protein BHK69_19410 [Bosea vaviloviae]|uniref:Uncharacterized protein n=1 Tax=Bosea vaviloviae TaxID=1526658 RepID=A0A1D7U4L4_9HYPH|nr:hypothetical protein BHK69_19410 [Bosea vaviloviae]
MRIGFEANHLLEQARPDHGVIADIGADIQANSARETLFTEHEAQAVELFALIEAVGEHSQTDMLVRYHCEARGG